MWDFCELLSFIPNSHLVLSDNVPKFGTYVHPSLFDNGSYVLSISTLGAKETNPGKENNIQHMTQGNEHKVWH
jgi:hypothetical protein